jgi:hypothetical protein
MVRWKKKEFRTLMALNHLDSFLRDESRSFPKAEGLNPRGRTYLLDDDKGAA